jgi:hypothetical protein
MPRQRLFVCFVLIWAVGVAGFLGGGLRRFLQAEPDDLPPRLALILTSENQWFHPATLQAYYAFFERIAGDVVLPVYAVTIESGPKQFADRDALARLIDTWLYPRMVAKKCSVEPGGDVVEVCALPASGAVVIGWGFTNLPGYECETHERNYVVCR